jgi:hypothetical protein
VNAFNMNIRRVRRRQQDRSGCRKRNLMERIVNMVNYPDDAGGTYLRPPSIAVSVNSSFSGRRVQEKILGLVNDDRKVRCLERAMKFKTFVSRYGER